MAAIVDTVDYSGHWVNSKSENMDNLLKSLGVGYMKRTAAQAMGYGKGKNANLIKADGDSVIITTVTRTGEFTNNLNVGAGEQQIDTQDGPEMGCAEWGSDGALVVKTKLMKKPVVVTRKILADGTLQMEIDHNNVKATRIFVKQ
uniref:Uncharacterized protein n=1 Tax=Mucochytrium quahogii TaxID=96639 RepID=A0A7S2SJ17_9STRA|mmetsp:Transcript_12009/g.19541  ORF Transcript_12009/g.19541 Transcript_12009/m.19541 type:complete len:145 (-) Transcript_12009:28-462(-)